MHKLWLSERTYSQTARYSDVLTGHSTTTSSRNSSSNDLQIEGRHFLEAVPAKSPPHHYNTHTHTIIIMRLRSTTQHDVQDGQ